MAKEQSERLRFIINKPSLEGKYPPVAQLDNAADSDSEDRGFESLRAGHKKRIFCLSKDAFFERCVPLTRNVMHTSCVMYPSEVMFAFGK